MTKGTVSGVIANMVTISVDGPVRQGEICFIETGGDKLMSEVIKVVGTDAYVQVFESTRGLKVGAPTEFTGRMLEIELGPGMLSKNYDGLQNDLAPSRSTATRNGTSLLSQRWATRLKHRHGSPKLLKTHRN